MGGRNSAKSRLLDFTLLDQFISGARAARLLNQYSPVPRARSSTDGKDTAQIYAGLGSSSIAEKDATRPVPYARADLCRLRKI